MDISNCELLRNSVSSNACDNKVLCPGVVEQNFLSFSRYLNARAL